MPQTWTLLPQPPVSAELLATVGGHPLIAALLAGRGIDTPDAALAFLNPDYYTPAPPSALSGVDEAAALLHAAVRRQEQILVWGDFDVDGQTSTSLLVAALQTLASRERVRFHVPNRFREGHGIKVEVLGEIITASEPAPRLLLTCDTGIAEGPGIAYAKDHGLTVVVTDHHDLPQELQNLQPGRDPLWGLNAEQAGAGSVRRADAIVNPKFLPPGDPLRTLPGVGVAYKLVQQLYALAGRSGEEEEFLDLVALGIVADVAEQVHDARYLLQCGLDKLRRTRRSGLLALMNVARLEPARIDAEAIGFQLGPRMNALGRLADATTAVELLTTHDPIRAGQLAAQMERLNQERRLLTNQIGAAALEMIERTPGLLDFNALVLAHPAWHAGIVGIVAARLAEEFGRPAVLLLNPPGEAARGSARSVPGVDIGAAIAACGHLLLGHGGHPGAAGLSLEADRIDAFRRELSRQVELHRHAEAPTGLTIDAEVPPEALSLALAEELGRLAPFGQGNPTPRLLSRRLTVVEDRRLGREGTHRRLVVRGAGGAAPPVIWFNGADAELPVGPIDLVYQLGVNEYGGERSAQLIFVAARPAIEEAAPAQLPAAVGRRLHDLRREPTSSLAALFDLADALWYAEGVQLEEESAFPSQLHFAPRSAIDGRRRGGALVIWSAPPSSELLHWLVQTAQPSEVYLCGQRTSDDSVSGVLQAAARMCKYALGRNSLLDIERMAARLGTTESIIRLCLLLLESRGIVRLVEWAPAGSSGDTLHIASGDGIEAPETRSLLFSELTEQLAEVRAYRRYYLHARPSELGLEER